MGSPSDWSPERIAIAPHRPLDTATEQLLADIDALRLYPFAERVALAVARRFDDAKYAWLLPPGLASDVDSITYVAPRGTRATLRCGIALHVTSEGRTEVAGPCELAAPDDEPLVIVAMTGLWLDSVTPSAEPEEIFLALGRHLVHELVHGGRKARKSRRSKR